MMNKDRKQDLITIDEYLKAKKEIIGQWQN